MDLCCNYKTPLSVDVVLTGAYMTCIFPVVHHPTIYSGTADKGPSEIGMTSLQGTNRWLHNTVVFVV